MKFVILLAVIAVAAKLSAACDCDYCINDDCINFSDGMFTVRRRRLALDTMDEVDSNPSETEMHEDKPEKECSPGAFFYEDCNSCFCTDEGIKNCSTKDCKESVPMKEEEEEETLHLDK